MSKREKVLLVLVIVVALGVGGYYFAYLPLTKEKAQLEQNIQDNQQELVRLQRLQQLEPTMDSSIAAIEAHLEEHQTALNAVGTLPQLVLFLADLERRSGVEVMHISPGGGTDGLSTLTTAIDGRLDQLIAYLEGLEQLTTIYEATSLNMVPQEEGVRANLAATFKHVEITDDVIALYMQYTTNVRFGKDNVFEEWAP